MRGYGVPDGLATLALDKTRCAPIPARNVATSSRPPARRQKLRRLRVAWGPRPSWASGRWPSRRGNRAHVGLRPHPGRLALWAFAQPRGCRAPPKGKTPRALFGRAAQEVFRLAPKSRHPVLGPAPATNRNGERRCGRGSAHSEAQISSRNAPADAHGNGVDSALGGGRAEASPAKIKSTEQNQTLCVRMPPLKQRSHNVAFCSPPLSRDRNSHSVSRFRRLPFLSVATAIQD